jgi:hypothetical protein
MNEADRPAPCRLKSWMRLKANRSSRVHRDSDIRGYRSPKQCRREEMQAANDEQRVWQISFGLAADGFEAHTSVDFQIRLSHSRPENWQTPAEFSVLGSTGCQPVAFGNLAECRLTSDVCLEQRFAASCCELQAGSLCPPETCAPASTIYDATARFNPESLRSCPKASALTIP